MDYEHIPVMLDEVLEYLHPSLGGNFIDCTLGGGSYTKAIAKKIGPQGKIIAIDRDMLAIDNAREKIKEENIVFVHSNYGNIAEAISPYQGGIAGFDGVVMDLGLSSAQLDDRSRGFSFLQDSPLDMGMGCNEDGYGTEYIVNFWSEAELRRVIREYGEERYANGISRAICRIRQNGAIDTTGKLLEVIKGAVPRSYVNGHGVHFATRTFQALRIATNRELESLESSLPQIMGLLKPGGRLVVVSFHSLEDRIVKNFFKQESRECLCPPRLPVCVCGHRAELKIISKKIIIPTAEEIQKNPRSRSAKMRVAEKI